MALRFSLICFWCVLSVMVVYILSLRCHILHSVAVDRLFVSDSQFLVEWLSALTTACMAACLLARAHSVEETLSSLGGHLVAVGFVVRFSRVTLSRDIVENAETPRSETGFCG